MYIYIQVNLKIHITYIQIMFAVSDMYAILFFIRNS